MIKEEIKSIIEKSLKNFTKEIPSFSLEFSSGVHGDYSTNVALALAKNLGKNPRDLAELIKKEIELKSKGLFKKVEMAGPGFINFFIADSVVIEAVKKIDKNVGRGVTLKNEKIAIEYTDPNILKEFHIGHLMSNAIGESLSRLLEFQGAKVKRFCYQGDVGLHIAKAIWGKLHNPQEPWGKAYAIGAGAYQEHEHSRQEMVALNKIIYERSDKEINRLYDEGKQQSLREFDAMYKKLGTQFDYFVFESQVAGEGKALVQGGLKEGVFENGEKGAVIFKGESYGLHTRVFINSEGLPTYEAKEMALAKEKYHRYRYEKSLVITGSEVNEYFKVMLCAMLQILPDLAKKTTHIGHGMMRLPEGKMSSRSGSVVTAESLLGNVEALVQEKIKDRALSEEEKKEIAKIVSVGAVKYSILKQMIGADIVYDFDKSISFEGDSGPYLQYAYTRAISVLRNAKEKKITPGFKKTPNEVSKLEKILCQFPEVVSEAARLYHPHRIAVYLTKLAAEFNHYYATVKIADETEAFSPYRLGVTQSFANVMENGLWLLGIQTLLRM